MQYSYLMDTLNLSRILAMKFIHFRKIKQNADETISKFFTRVKQQTVKCDFGENLNNEIKQQMFKYVDLG